MWIKWSGYIQVSIRYVFMWYMKMINSWGSSDRSTFRCQNKVCPFPVINVHFGIRYQYNCVPQLLMNHDKLTPECTPTTWSLDYLTYSLACINRHILIWPLNVPRSIDYLIYSIVCISNHTLIDTWMYCDHLITLYNH